MTVACQRVGRGRPVANLVGDGLAHPVLGLCSGRLLRRAPSLLVAIGLRLHRRSHWAKGTQERHSPDWRSYPRHVSITSIQIIALGTLQTRSENFRPAGTKKNGKMGGAPEGKEVTEMNN